MSRLYPHPTLREIVARILEYAGSRPAEARLVAEHLVEANLAGHDSHGVGMIPTYIDNVLAGTLKPNRTLECRKDDGSVLMFDAQHGYGQVMAREAMNRAIERTREKGLVLFTLGRSHHIGRIGSYGEQAIEAGLVSLHFVNVTDHRPLVAPFGGSDSRYGTNPICMAMPGTEQTPPLLLDMATSRIALGKTRVAMNQGVPVPEGCLIDAEGKATTDPKVMFTEPPGALLALGEHKGYGLALFCELLADGLSGGGTIQPEHERHGSIVNNMFTILVEPSQLVDMTFLKREIDALSRYFTDSPPLDADREVLLPGEPERRSRRSRSREGIPLAPATWSGIVAAARRVGVPDEVFGNYIP